MWRWWIVIAGLSMACGAGATSDVPAADSTGGDHQLIVGRVFAVKTGATTRIYGPDARTIELEECQTRARINIEVKSDDQRLAAVLPPGTSRLDRARLNEGLGLSIEGLDAVVPLDAKAMTCVGAWQCGGESPSFERHAALAMVLEGGPKARLDALLSEESLEGETLPVVSVCLSRQ